MFKIPRSIAALMSLVMLTATMSLSMGQVAQAAGNNKTGLEPVVVSQTVDTDFATPVTFTPVTTSIGVGLGFCFVEAQGNKGCNGTNNGTSAAPKIPSNNGNSNSNGNSNGNSGNSNSGNSNAGGNGNSNGNSNGSSNGNSNGNSGNSNAGGNSNGNSGGTGSNAGGNGNGNGGTGSNGNGNGNGGTGSNGNGNGNGNSGGNGNNYQAVTTYFVPNEGTWTVNPNTGEVTFAPLSTFSGRTTAVTYRATDSFGSGDATLAVNVGKPGAPVVSATLATTLFDTSVTVTPTVTGGVIVDSSACFVSGNSCLKTLVVASEGTWTINADRSATFVPDALFAGTATAVEYRVADSFGQATSGLIVIAVGNPDGPKINSQLLETDFNSAITFTPDIVSGTAIAHSKTCLVRPADGLCVKRLNVVDEGLWTIANDGTVTFTPTSTYSGTTTAVTVRVSDSYRQTGGKCKDLNACASQSTSASLQIKVRGPNHPMTTKSMSKETEYDTSVSFTPVIDGAVAGSKIQSCIYDPNDGICKSIVQVANKGTWTVNQNTGVVTFDPLPTFAGKTDPVIYSAVDQYGRGANGTLKVHVKTPGSQAVTNNSASTTVDTPVIFSPKSQGHRVDYSTACLIDPANGSCVSTVTIAGEGTWLVLDNGQVQFSPASGFMGNTTSVEYQVTALYGPKGLCASNGPDAKGKYNNGEQADDSQAQSEGTHACFLTATGKLTVSVVQPNAPKVWAKRVTTAFDTNITFLPKASGSYLDRTTACLIDPTNGNCVKTLYVPTRGTFIVDAQTGQVTFSPDAGFVGETPSIYYRLFDNFGAYGQNLVRVTVEAPVYPTTGETWQTTQFQQAITFMPTVLGYNLQYSSACLVDPADNVCKQTVIYGGYGTFSVNNTDGKVTFVPAANFVGVVPTIEYRIVDGFGWTGDNCANGTSGDCDGNHQACDKHHGNCSTAESGMHDDEYTSGDPSSTGCSDSYEADGPSIAPSQGVGDGDYESDSEDGGYHSCKNLVTNIIHVFVEDVDAPTVDPAVGTTPWNTPIELNPVVHTVSGTTVDPTKACLIDPADNVCKLSVSMAGKGVWTVSQVDGSVVFTPYNYFAGLTPKIVYRAYDSLGKFGQNTLQVTVLAPQKPTDGSTHKVTPFNTPITFMPTVSGTRLLSYTACLIDPADGQCKKTVTYPGEGTFVVDKVTGEVTFTPAAGFVGTTDPIVYQLVDAFGWEHPYCQFHQNGICKGVNVCLNKDPNAFLAGTDDEAVYTDESGEGDATCFYRVTNSVTVTVLPPAAPIVKPVSTSTPFNTPATMKPEVTGYDIQWDLSCIVVGETCVQTLDVPGKGTWVVNPDGSVTFTPVDGFIGKVPQITYRAFDAFGISGENTIDLTVNEEPAPTVDDVDTTTPFATTKDITLSTHGYNIDPLATCFVVGNTCVRELIVSEQGTWKVMPDGTIKFIPDYGFHGHADPVTVQVTDGKGKTGTGTIKIEVLLPVAPVVDDIDTTTPYNTAWKGTPTVTGTEIDRTTACIKTANSCVKQLTVTDQGTWKVDSITGEVTFTPVVGFAGKADYVVYYIEDGYGQGATGTITITVENPAAPEAKDLTDTTPYNTAWKGTPEVTGTNVDFTTACIMDGVNCVKTLVVPNQGTWSVNELTGEVTFTPVDGFAGKATAVTYSVSDIYGQTATATITITVNKPTAPAVKDITDTTPYNTAWKGTPEVTGTKIDRTTACIVSGSDCVLSLTVTDEGTWTVNDQTGEVTFTPLDTFTGSATPVTYYIEDEFGQSGTGTISITVQNPSHPIVHDVDKTTPYDTNWVGTPKVNGAHLDWTTACFVTNTDCVKSLLVAGEGSWTIDATTGEVTFNPEANFTGKATAVTYRMCDDFSQCDEGVINIEVLKPGAPQVDNLSDKTPWNTPKSVNPTVNGTGIDPTKACFLDADNNCVTTLVIPGEGTWTIDPNSSNPVTFTPERGFYGKTSKVTFQATNSFGDKGTGTISILVEDPKGPSLASPTTPTIPYFTTTKLQPVGTKGDGSLVAFCIKTADDCVLTVTTQQGTWTIAPLTGEVSFAAAEGFAGTAGPITVQVIDEFNLTATASVTVIVDKPAPPIVDPGNKTVEFNTEAKFTPNVTGTQVDPSTACVVDTSNNTCVKDLTTPDGKWHVDPTTGEVTFTPTPGFTGKTTVEYRITDKFGQTGSAPVSVTVLPAPTGQLTGVIWLDLNKNNKRDLSEPGLPGVEVTVTGNSPGAMIRTSVSKIVRAGAGTSKVIQAVVSAPKYTDKNGFYSFEVTPGSYTVKALLNTSKLYTSWDTTGNADWTVPVSVPLNESVVADFSAAGNGSLGGTVTYDNGTKIPLADVTCIWSGLDETFGTADDISVIGKADGKGGFSFTGLPGGSFDCDGVDPTTGAGSAVVPVTVDNNSATPAKAIIKINRVKKYSFTVSGFKPGSPVFTKPMIKRLLAQLKSHPGYVRVTIKGFTMGPTILKVDKKLSLDRAKAAWVRINTSNNIAKLVKYAGYQDYKRLGSKIRRVFITLYFY